MAKRLLDPSELPLSIISGKWKGTILWALRDGPLRSGKLKAHLPGITGAAFSNAVRDLEEAGALKRKAKETVPPEVSYQITPRGESLLPILRVLVKLGFDHQRECGVDAFQ